MTATKSVQVRPTRDDALALAVRTFNSGNRVEVNDLAARLGVNRVTVYRWLGDRFELLSEVVWSLAEPTMRAAYRAAAGQGGARIAETMSTFCRQTLGHHGMRFFLANESDAALRILTSGAQPFQARLIDLVHELLVAERDAGRLSDPTIELHDLAYLCVRVGESFVYTDAIIGEPADPDRAERALHYLLR